MLGVMYVRFTDTPLFRSTLIPVAMKPHTDLPVLLIPPALLTSFTHSPVLLTPVSPSQPYSPWSHPPALLTLVSPPVSPSQPYSPWSHPPVLLTLVSPSVLLTPVCMDSYSGQYKERPLRNPRMPGHQLYAALW